MGREQKAESRKNTQEIREKLKAPKCPPECPKTSPREPKTAQNGAKSAPRRPQDEPKRDKKANPNRKMKKETNQDDPKTVLDRPPADLPSSAAPLGLHLGGQNGTKTDPKTIKNRSENRRGKKSYPRRSWTRLGAILGRLGCHLGPTWTSISCSRPRWRSFFGKINCSMLRRFEDGFGTNLGGPSRQKE